MRIASSRSRRARSNCSVTENTRPRHQAARYFLNLTSLAQAVDPLVQLPASLGQIVPPVGRMGDNLGAAER